MAATWSELWDLTKKPAIALAVYLAILSLRFSFYYPIHKVKDGVMALLMKRDLKLEELMEMQKALDMLVELLDSEKRKGASIPSLLEELEEDNYELFKNALYGYLKKGAPLDELKEAVETLVMWKVGAPQTTSKGSYFLNIEAGRQDFMSKLAGLEELGFFILTEKSGPYTNIVVPAPYTDTDILKVLEGREVKVEAKVEGVEEIKCKFEDIKPTKEILEGIVAEALKSLGFAVRTNVKLPAKGGDVEVDVWAFKNVGGAQFRVYASCKNWDKDVDRAIVDQEFGRVLQLYQLPHLRIFVAKGLTEPARKTAFDDGFFVIELGEKASTENAREIYDIVYGKLKEMFIGIAPDRIVKVVDRLKEALRELEELM